MYSFALNEQKLARAIANSKDKSEESVYAEYVKIAGLVNPDYNTAKAPKPASTLKTDDSDEDVTKKSK